MICERAVRFRDQTQSSELVHVRGAQYRLDRHYYLLTHTAATSTKHVPMLMQTQKPNVTHGTKFFHMCPVFICVLPRTYSGLASATLPLARLWFAGTRMTAASLGWSEGRAPTLDTALDGGLEVASAGDTPLPPLPSALSLPSAASTPGLDGRRAFSSCGSPRSVEGGPADTGLRARSCSRERSISRAAAVCLARRRARLSSCESPGGVVSG